MTPHALRTAVGDRTFFRILRTWASGHRDGHGTTAPFVRLAEHQSGQDLDALFRACCTRRASRAARSRTGL